MSNNSYFERYENRFFQNFKTDFLFLRNIKENLRKRNSRLFYIKIIMSRITYFTNAGYGLHESSAFQITKESTSTSINLFRIQHYPSYLIDI